MKKLTALIISGLIAISPLISQETNLEKSESIATKTLRSLGVPEELVRYQESQCWGGPIDIGGNLLGMIEYDTNNDGKPDVQEIYRITSQDSDGIYHGPEQPILYGFDFDKDGIFGEEGELIQDKEEDGLNGNEIWFRSRLIKNL